MQQQNLNPIPAFRRKHPRCAVVAELDSQSGTIYLVATRNGGIVATAKIYQMARPPRQLRMHLQ